MNALTIRMGAMACCSLALSTAILCWAFGYAIHDESSLGTLGFVWGGLCALLVALPSLGVIGYVGVIGLTDWRRRRRAADM